MSAAVGISNAETRERETLQEMFNDAYERCRTNPMDGVAFNIQDFHTAIQKYDFNSEIGTKVSSPLPLIFYYLFVNILFMF